MPFKPGQSGNPSGRQTEKQWRTNLDRAILQDDAKRLRKAAEKVLDLAAAGEEWAINHLADRLDGRPAQAVTVAGDPEAPFVLQVVNYAGPDVPT